MCRSFLLALQPQRKSVNKVSQPHQPIHPRIRDLSKNKFLHNAITTRICALSQPSAPDALNLLCTFTFRCASSQLLKNKVFQPPDNLHRNLSLLNHQVALNTARHCYQCPVISTQTRTLITKHKPLSVVEDDGIEPTTPCLQSRCSPS